MPYEVRVTSPAKDDIWRNYRWWGEHRSREQADRWFNGIGGLIDSLAQSANQHALATEPALRALGIRQVSFGTGRRPTHRVLYGLHGKAVVVYRVRAYKQDAIGTTNLQG